MFEFPSSRNDWRLDIVSILAVLGENNIKIHAQAMTATNWCLLPRLIPAPQGLLREMRPKRMPYVEDVSVYGVQTGSKRDGLSFIPSLIHRIDGVPSYSVEVHTIDEKPGSPPVTYKTFAPLNLLAIGSCLLSVGLIVWSIVLHDSIAFIALLFMSTATSALGYASRWDRRLPQKRPTYFQDIIKRNDVVLRTRWGAFIVVRCSEKTAQELYWSPEECLYLSPNWLSRLSGGVVGGLMAMTAVVLFANCSTWAMQAAIGTSYAFLNVSYWVVTVIPEAWSWNLNVYTIIRHSDTVKYSRTPSFVKAVSAAIKLTQSTAWVCDNNIKRAGDSGWMKQRTISRIFPGTPKQPWRILFTRRMSDKAFDICAALRSRIDYLILLPKNCEDSGVITYSLQRLPCIRLKGKKYDPSMPQSGYTWQIATKS